MIIAGIDEAGYGPLLGPLVVSATAFEVPGQTLPTEPSSLPCLWKLLKSAVAKKPSTSARGKLLVADSKVVHHLSDGNKLLERGALVMLAAMQPKLEVAGLCRSRLIDILGCTKHGLNDLPWYAADDPLVPLWADAGDLAIAKNVLRGAMENGADPVRIAAMRTAVLSERAYNSLVATTHNKGAALVSITMTHLHWLYTQFAAQGLVVGVDKQGGRDRYTDLLLRTFPDAQLKVIVESEAGSSYLVHEGPPIRQAIIHFREKAESLFLPTALASMLCKYLREMCMASFNVWWGTQVPDLKPTAGYYQDGMRWLADVRPHLARLNVHTANLVRSR